jgi:hypothetical protein
MARAILDGKRAEGSDELVSRMREFALTTLTMKAILRYMLEVLGNLRSATLTSGPSEPVVSPWLGALRL